MENNRMKFLSEDGEVVELQAMARIFLDEVEYLILAPLEDEESEFVFRVDHEGEEEVYNALTSDEEFLKVKKEYSRILYDEKETNQDE